MVIMIQSCCYIFNLCSQTDKMSIYDIQVFRSWKNNMLHFKIFGWWTSIHILSASISLLKKALPIKIDTCSCTFWAFPGEEIRKDMCYKVLQDSEKKAGTLMCPCDLIFGIPHFYIFVKSITFLLNLPNFKSLQAWKVTFFNGFYTRLYIQPPLIKHVPEVMSKTRSYIKTTWLIILI